MKDKTKKWLAVAGLLAVCAVLVFGISIVPDVAAAEVETALRQITGSGYRVLLAHIER